MTGFWIAFVFLYSSLGLGRVCAEAGTPYAIQEPGRSKIRVSLHVTVLETVLGADGLEAPLSSKEISLEVPPSYRDQIAAYGAAGQVLIGFRGWTGSALLAANGTIQIDMRPQEASWKNGCRINMTVGSPGLGSTLFRAAPYFPWIMANWPKLMETEKPESCPIISHFVTPFLNRYEASDTPSGLKVRGVAYSNAEKHFQDRDWSFYQFEIVFPSEKLSLAECLLDVFIDRYDLANMHKNPD